MALELLLEFPRTARRTAHRVRGNFANTRCPKWPSLADYADHQGHAAGIAEVHLERYQKRAHIRPSTRKGTPMNEGCEVHMREAMLDDRRQSGFVNALRVHKSLTAEVEKRLLVWMAERTPKAISSDHLTAQGFISQILAGAAYALAALD